MTLHPDRWFIVNMTLDGDTTQHVFSGSYGGYTGSDSWRMSTAIETIVREDKVYKFETRSGTSYECHIGAFGASGYMMNVYQYYLDENKDKLSIDSFYAEAFREYMRNQMHDKTAEVKTELDHYL